MKSYYTHPNLYTSAGAPNCPIFDISNPNKPVMLRMAPQNVPNAIKIITWEEFEADMIKMEQMRRELGIPIMSYPAWIIPPGQWNPADALVLLNWLRPQWETRYWLNPSSYCRIIAVADPDTSVNSGTEFYEWTHANIPASYEWTLAYPAWWEFCQHGMQIPEDWTLEITPSKERLRCVCPHKKLGFLIG